MCIIFSVHVVACEARNSGNDIDCTFHCACFDVCAGNGNDWGLACNFFILTCEDPVSDVSLCAAAPETCSTCPDDPVSSSVSSGCVCAPTLSLPCPQK